MTDVLTIITVPAVLAGGWYVVTGLRSAHHDEPNEGEQWILSVVLAFVATLTAYNIFVLHSTSAARF